jgi:simple sugar transport system ATP-binding protein
VAAQTEVASASERDFATMMFGATPAPARAETLRKVVVPAETGAYLVVDDVQAIGDRGTPAVTGVTLSVAPGEIVGIAGVSGNGQKELVEILAGQRDASRGSVRVAGRSFRGTRRELERCGVSLLTEEPLASAAVRSMSVMENLALRQFDQPPLAMGGFILKRRALRPFAEALIAHYRIRTGSPAARLDTLSGGNIQRTVLARELSRQVRLLIMQNPCFGLDVAAAAEIRRRIVGARDGGAAVLLLSEDLDEVLELSDRVLVMSGGRITYQTARADADRYEIGRHMTLGPARHSP